MCVGAFVSTYEYVCGFAWTRENGTDNLIGKVLMSVQKV